MVKTEKFAFKKGQPTSSRLVCFQPNVTIVSLERVSNGSWFVVADLTMEFRPCDGRVLRFSKQVRLRGEQSGKRPHPDPFGWKQKKKKKARGKAEFKKRGLK